MSANNRLDGLWPKPEPVTNFTRGSKEWSDDVSAAYYEGVANERTHRGKKLRTFRSRLQVHRAAATRLAYERGWARGLFIGIAIGLIGILFVWWKLKG